MASANSRSATRGSKTVSGATSCAISCNTARSGASSATARAVGTSPREPQGESAGKAREAIGGKVRVATFADAAKESDLAVLATGWAGTESAARLAGAERLAGKVVIDATNPLDFSGGAPRLVVGFSTS